MAVFKEIKSRGNNLPGKYQLSISPRVLLQQWLTYILIPYVARLSQTDIIQRDRDYGRTAYNCKFLFPSINRQQSSRFLKMVFFA